MAGKKKDIGPRPPCEECGCEDVTSSGLYWRCTNPECTHQWKKMLRKRPMDRDEISDITVKEPVGLLMPPEKVISGFTERTIVALFDAHLDPMEHVHSAFWVAKQFTIDMQPDIIVIGGDWGEFGSVSAWERKKSLLIEGKRYKLEIEMYKSQLWDIRNRCPKSKIYFFEGNHEYRIPRYVEEHSNMEGLLDCREDMEIDNMEIEWVPYNKIIKLGKLNFLHGIYYNKYFARSTLEAIGESCIFGHSHKSQTYTQRLHNDKQPNIGCGIGCLCDLDPGWKRGIPTNFVNSFAYIDMRSDGGFNIHELIVIRDQVSFGGRTWAVE